MPAGPLIDCRTRRLSSGPLLCRQGSQQASQSPAQESPLAAHDRLQPPSWRWVAVSPGLGAGSRLPQQWNRAGC